MDSVTPNGPPPAAPSDEASAPRDPGLLGRLFPVLLVLFGLGFLFQRFGIDGMISIGLVAVGLGFVIFIHELGHFAVAKWCDVHVEAFSIGFGPAIPGCSFRRGETLYKIAWFPLGGYVKMVGEGSDTEEDDDDPRSFKNKTVWQRMAIISAGVIMNLIFGFLIFILVYTKHGVERPPGIVGLVDAGSPAWEKGIPSGSVIERIGSVTDPYFDDLKPEVAFSSKGQKLSLVYLPPGQNSTSVATQIEPRRNEKDPSPVIGIAPPYDLKLFPKDRRNKGLPVLAMSAAADAQPPFEFGDTIVATTDPDHPSELAPVQDFNDLARRDEQLAGKPMVVQVRREMADHQSQLVEIQVPPAYHYVFGLRMRMGRITGVREGSPAARAGIIARNPGQGIEGDILDQVEVTDATGAKIRYVTSQTKPVPAEVKIKKLLDPVRLPDELNAWADSITGPKSLKLIVLRTVNHTERQEVTLDLAWDDKWRLDQEVPFSPLAPLPIPCLGLAYQIETAIEDVADRLPGGDPSPAFEAGLKRGDVVKALRFTDAGEKPGQSEPGKWLELEPEQWAHVFYGLQERSYKNVTLRVERDGQSREVALAPVLDKSWPLSERGILLMPATRLQKADSVAEAIRLGTKRSIGLILQIYQNLLAMITRRVSPTTVGGPIMIAKVAYAVASQDLYTFAFFLGMISINLAVINFLPIPVLDGGHMVFLIWEKIRGIPASESLRNAATIVGLVVILLLVVFTFWVDLVWH